MKRVITLGILGILLLLGLFSVSLLLTPSASADATAVDAANQLYAAGHYAEAAQIFEQELTRGVEDSTLYFNLGNAYYQQGDLGRAVLNYQRAAQLAPRDADIQANLELARAQTTELLAAEPEGPLAALADLTGWLTLNETAVIVLAFWFLLGFLLLARQQIKAGKGSKWLGYTAVVILTLLIISGLSLGSRAILQQTQPEGVVVAPTVAVSSSPGAEPTTGISLMSGTQVNVVETQGDWVRVNLPGSAESWLPTQAVEPVTGFAAQSQDI